LSMLFTFFFSSRRRHTRFSRDWSSDVCSSDLGISVWSFLCVLANCVLIFAVCNGKSNVIKDFALFTKSFITYPFFKNKTNRGKRSEEHTSELQSRENLVCRLLLEKKKTEHKER